MVNEAMADKLFGDLSTEREEVGATMRSLAKEPSEEQMPQEPVHTPSVFLPTPPLPPTPTLRKSIAKRGTSLAKRSSLTAGAANQRRRNKRTRSDRPTAKRRNPTDATAAVRGAETVDDIGPNGPGPTMLILRQSRQSQSSQGERKVGWNIELRCLRES
ncbi:unnamed protein product [Protopolystoma xenopodis]|uniref:Uncharacterized protein n=1 Tax=Protopolystoma xenopodis TaxID=117903 RepID=A0A3S5C5X8_9PLAT|nr:unnamed protein product [Protopolystoma xenopodis]